MAMPGIISTIIHDFIRPTAKSAISFKRKMKKIKEKQERYNFANFLCEKFLTDRTKFFPLNTSFHERHDGIETRHINPDGNIWRVNFENRKKIHQYYYNLNHLIMKPDYKGAQLQLKIIDPLAKNVAYMYFTECTLHNTGMKLAARQCELFNRVQCDTDPPEILKLRLDLLKYSPMVMSYKIKIRRFDRFSQHDITFILTNPEATQWEVKQVDTLLSRKWLCEKKIVKKTTCGCGSHVSNINTHRKTKKHMAWLDT
jgi:hypothetical protein